MHKTAPEDAILDALGTLGRSLTRRTVGIIDQGGYWVLYVLNQADQTRMGELAQRCLLDSSTISRHVRSLEQRGLIRRSPDPDDGRAQLVELTDQGRDLLHRARGERRRLLIERLHSWSPEDLDTLLTLLNRLTQPSDPESDVDDKH